MILFFYSFLYALTTRRRGYGRMGNKEGAEGMGDGSWWGMGWEGKRGWDMGG